MSVPAGARTARPAGASAVSDNPRPPPGARTARPSSVADSPDNVRVVVRARPLVEAELAKRCHRCIKFAPDGQQVVLGKDRVFKYDFAFDEESSQEQVHHSAPTLAGAFTLNAFGHRPVEFSQCAIVHATPESSCSRHTASPCT